MPAVFALDSTARARLFAALNATRQPSGGTPAGQFRDSPTPSRRRFASFRAERVPERQGLRSVVAQQYAAAGLVVSCSCCHRMSMPRNRA